MRSDKQTLTFCQSTIENIIRLTRTQKREMGVNLMYKTKSDLNFPMYHFALYSITEQNYKIQEVGQAN